MNTPKSIVYLNSNSPSEENLLALGVHKQLTLTENQNAFDSLEKFLLENPKWVFGYLAYDLKNEDEALQSLHVDEIEAPKMCFFVPKVVYTVKNGKAQELVSYDTQFSELITDPLSFLEPEKGASHSHASFKSRVPKRRYLQKVGQFLKHIQRGDIYEANFCVEFFKEKTSLAPLATYHAVNENTKAPYSSYFKHGPLHAICASPELYLEKKGSSLVSKPIKGTKKRGTSIEEDVQLKEALLADQKERSENVMIVDLVRNDLSKTAATDSVKVEELYGIYSFETVHHMISTVASVLHEKKSSVDALRTTFPMGSMTGAPKVSAMNLIETYEESKRGMYSGALGYFTPEGDFTFNVVIRTLLYNQEKKYLSLMAGGAITAASDPESEYRECLLKAAALKKAIHEFH